MIGFALMLAVAPAFPMQRAATPCEIAADPELLWKQEGRRLTVTGSYEWEIHSGFVRPDACVNDVIFVGFTSAAYAQIDSFLRTTYPGINFGGGSVWGTFTGVMTIGREGPPYLMIDTIVLDPVRRMTIGN